MAPRIRNKGASAQSRPEPMPARPALAPDLPAPKVIAVRSGRIACDGVGGALGHPRVWIELGGDDVGECPYCDRRFVLAGSGHESERRAPGVYEGSSGH